MRIYLDRYFNFYTRNQKPWIEVEVKKTVPLSVVLASAGIPIEEVHLALVNGEAVDPQTIFISRKDQIKIFPPFGGG